MAPRKKTNTETVLFSPMQFNYKGSIIKIVPNEIQTSSKGISFIYKSITKNQHVNSIFVNGIEKFHWIYKFEYLNFTEKGFSIEIDYNDNIIKFTNTTSR